MPDSLRVISIIGVSYCGSTLLNYILDSHPDIYGGGELHALVTRDDKPGCKACGKACGFWTRNNLESVGENSFYDNIARIFGVDRIADTSKNTSWFERSMSFSCTRPVEFVPVLMVKHPVRLLASFLANQTLRGRTSDPLKEEYCRYWFDKPHKDEAHHDDERKREVRRLLLRKYMGIIFNFYSDTIARAQALFGNRIILLRYEDLVNAPREAVEPILGAVDLEYEESMLDCYEKTHHDIGGNSGTSYQYHKNDRITFQEYHPAREKYYRNMKGICMDDKYRDVFSGDELQELQESDQAREFSRYFGYGRLLMPEKTVLFADSGL